MKNGNYESGYYRTNKSKDPRNKNTSDKPRTVARAHRQMTFHYSSIYKTKTRQ
jgi:hypothetical protein